MTDRRFYKSVRWRLTIMYALLVVIVLAAILAFSYSSLQSSLQASTDAGLLNEISEYHALLENQDFGVLRDVLEQEAISEGVDRVFYRVVSLRGDVMFSTNMNSWNGVRTNHSHVLSADGGAPVFETQIDTIENRNIRIIYGGLSEGQVLQIGESQEENKRTLNALVEMFSVGISVALLVSLPAGLLLSSRAMRGVEQITKATREIADGNWYRRIPISSNNDEIDTLAESFNNMVDKIQILINELKEVTDDIAHDLRTPLTRMRMGAESAILEADRKGEVDEFGAYIVQECDSLLELINTMLEISKTNSGIKSTTVETLDLAEIASDIGEFFEPVANEKQVQLIVNCISRSLVRGDRKQLERALANLVDNAVKYSHKDGTITLRIRSDQKYVECIVEDTGIGISEEEMPRIFERFYRGDESRASEGNGLGLALVESIVKSHQGTITATSKLNAGSCFTIRIPAADQ